MVPSKINPRLDQRKFFRRRQSFELTTDGQLAIHVSDTGSSEDWKISLQSLGLETWRSKLVYWQALFFVVPFALAALFSLYGAWTSADDSVGFIVIAAFFAAIASFFFYLMLVRSYDILCFPRGEGRLALWHNNPSAPAFEAFVEQLTKAIKKARDSAPPPNDSMASEIERLKGLLDRGLLTEAQFEAGKNKLLGIEPERRIGF